MANIKTTVDGMPIKDLTPVMPEPEGAPTPPLPAAAKIKEIAKEIAQPWKYGAHIQGFSRRHGVPMVYIEEIYKAVQERRAKDAPEVIEP